MLRMLDRILSKTFPAQPILRDFFFEQANRLRSFVQCPILVGFSKDSREILANSKNKILNTGKQIFGKFVKIVLISPNFSGILKSGKKWGKIGVESVENLRFRKYRWRHCWISHRIASSTSKSIESCNSFQSNQWRIKLTYLRWRSRRWKRKIVIRRHCRSTWIERPKNWLAMAAN